MAYRDELTQQTSFDLYRTLANFLREGGELTPDEEEFVNEVGNTRTEDERYKEALVDLVERLHDGGIL